MKCFVNCNTRAPHSSQLRVAQAEKGKKKEARFVRSIRCRKDKNRAKNKWWVCAHGRLLNDRGMMV